MTNYWNLYEIVSDHGFSKLILEMFEANKHVFSFNNQNMDIELSTSTNLDALSMRRQGSFASSK